MIQQIKTLSWTGSSTPYIDQPDVQKIGRVVIGRFGGNSDAGQTKNEDGCLIWIQEKEEWEFVMILDAHNSAQSAELVTAQVEQHQDSIASLLSGEIGIGFFSSFEKILLQMFREKSFMEACRHVQGETACLIAVRKGKYVYWFSIGDCLLYVFHPELAAFGQYQINQRQFYEWIGQVNTFEGAVPCYSSGTRELRQGDNHLFLTTDGLVECPGEPFAETKAIRGCFKGVSNEQGVSALLTEIQKNGVRDSTTVISWEISVHEKAAMASNQ